MNSYIEEALIALKRKMPDDCDAEYQQVKKNNGVVRDGFVIHKMGKSIAPTFYLTDKEKEKIEAELLVKAKQIEEQREVIAFWEELAKWLIEAIDAIMQMINELFNDRTDDYRSEELKNSIQDYCNKIRLKISRIDFWREYR